MSTRGPIALFLLVGCVGGVLMGCRTGSPSGAAAAIQVAPIQVAKEPVSFSTRTFDPSAPPPEMPPLNPGELAVCDSDFTSAASLSGETRTIDSTHGMLTITGAKVTLEANITIWVPTGASTGVIEHEQGHRQISEYYYQTADRLARQIAETYVGRQVPIDGADLNAAANTELHQLASEFTAEYGKQLNPDPAQELYDSITDHSRNQTPVSDAVAAALKNVEATAPHPVTDAQN